MKVNLYSCVTLLLLCSMVTRSTSQTNLINPHLPNSFLDSYVLPDRTIRFIGSEHGRDRELFYVDKRTDGSIAEPVFFPESFGELEFNFAGVDCKILPLKTGDLILGINQNDCDYTPYSSLARCTIEGDVVWAISMEHFNFNNGVQKLTQVDSNIICLISTEVDTLYFDMAGNEVTPSDVFVVYDTIASAPTGYYATIGEDLYRLDERFDVFNVVTLDDTIQTLSVSGDTMVIVSTSSSLVILEDNFDLSVHSDVFGDFDLVTHSKDWIWIGQRNGDIIQLDYLLQPYDTIIMPKGIQLKSMVVINEFMTLGGNYLSVTGGSIIFHTAHANQFNFSIKKDVRMESVIVEEPVFYSFEPGAEPWGFNIPYNNVVVTVSNTGQDTIQSLTILYGAGSGCLFCQGEGHRWAFDSLNVYPGVQMDFELGDFSVWCVTPTPTKFCLSIFPADSLPETDQFNNSLCVDVDAMLTGVNEVESSRCSVSPNPADHLITIHIDEVSVADYHGEILNGNGTLVERFVMPENDLNMEVSHLSPGIYFLTIFSSTGGYLSKKFIVIH